MVPRCIYLGIEKIMKQQVVWINDDAIDEVSKIIERESYRKILLVIDAAAYKASGAQKKLESVFCNCEITQFSSFALNPKLEDVERGIEIFTKNSPDVVLAIGGGSAMDMAKLIGVLAWQDASPREVVTGEANIESQGPPMIVVPTTSGTGSEATHFAVVYIDGVKYSLAHDCLLPDYVIIDPVLTYSLPPEITAASGLDAFCQSIESIWAVGSTEESIGYASEAAKLVFENLPSAVNNPNPKARWAMSRAAYLSGKSINISKTTAPHALSYFMTGKYGLPHGIAVSLTLAPLLIFNAQVTEADCIDPRGHESVLSRIDLILEILGVDDVPSACQKIVGLLKDIKCPVSLVELGYGKDKIIREMVSRVNPERLSNNPRRASGESLIALLKRPVMMS